MEKVMNNPDLRGVIFSYFRTKAYKQCKACKIVCRWNENSFNNPYVEWDSFINCHNCFKTNFLSATNYCKN